MSIASNINTVAGSGSDGQFLGHVAGAPAWIAAPSGSGSSFSAYLNNDATGVTGDGTTANLICDTVFFDTASSYNAGTGVYTAAATGHYFFGVNLMYNGTIGVNATGSIYLGNGGGINRQIYYGEPFKFASSLNGYGLISATIALPLTIGDTIQIFVAIYGNATPNINFVGYTGNSNQVSSLFYGFQIA